MTANVQVIYNALLDLPEDKLHEVWQFVEYLKFKQTAKKPPPIVKLGGLLKSYGLDLTEADIKVARQEMWGNIGSLNE